MDFACPKCRAALLTDGNLKKCENGHSFDRARAGYYNLLLGSSGGVHGDNRDMVEARRRFLSADNYLPLARAIAAIAVDNLSDGSVVLDCGCGEGYYTSKIYGELKNAGRTVDFLAFDISRDAVKLAARVCPDVSFAVASCYDVPMADSSVDLALNIFSPLAPLEMHRILKDGGRYVVAYPDEHHLYELKSAIYDTPYKNTPATDAPSGFTLVGRERVAYTLDLSTNGAVMDLFMMTPYAYRTGKRERERLGKIESLSTRVEFLIDVYEKLGD